MDPLEIPAVTVTTPPYMFTAPQTVVASDLYLASAYDSNIINVETAKRKIMDFEEANPVEVR